MKNEFGWHVVKVEERRSAAPPSFSHVHDQLRQALLAASVRQTIENARGQVAVHRFNLDGTEIEATPRRDEATAPADDGR